MKFTEFRADVHDGFQFAKANKVKTTKRIALLGLLLAVIGLVMPNLVVTYTDSVDYNVLWKSGKAPIKGDLAFFPFQHEYLGDTELKLLTKRLRCMPGDRLETKGRQHYCNGVLVSEALYKTIRRQPLTLFEYNGDIPNGMVFMLGDNPRSFDSRYNGFIKYDSLTRAVGLL